MELAKRGAAVALFVSELTALVAALPSGRFPSSGTTAAPFALLLAVHVANVAVLLALTMQARWPWVATGVLVASWFAVAQWQSLHAAEWPQLLALAGALYALFTAYALIAGPRQRERREPWMVALGAAAMAFVAGREAFVTAGLQWMIGVVPVLLGAVTAFLLRALLRLERSGERDMTRLAVVAGAALALVTVAIPLQLDHQWVTIGWALEGAALAWLYQRVPHRGLLVAATGLLIVVFVRLGLNPSIWTYEPRGALRIFNWYLYTYAIAAISMFAAAWFLTRTDDRPASWLPPSSRLLPALATVLLFLLLNIEIADYYATGPAITFRFGVTGLAGPDLHHRLARLRDDAARCRHLPPQPAGAHRSRQPDRRDGVQVLPLRSGIARRAVSSGVVRRPRHRAGAGVAGAAEIRAGEARGSRDAIACGWSRQRQEAGSGDRIVVSTEILLIS